MINMPLSNEIFVSLGDNDWYFKYNERYYEMISYVAICESTF